MSDLEQTHWDDGHDSLLDGCPWCEIERLREQVRVRDNDVTNFREIADKRLNRIEALEKAILVSPERRYEKAEQRIEELEKVLDRIGDEIEQPTYLRLVITNALGGEDE